MSSDPEKVPQDGAPQAEAQQAAGEASAAPSSEPAAASAEQTFEQKLTEAQAESARLLDQLRRMAADFDNFRKRARRDEADATKRGREGLLKDILPVFDNLERAVQHADGAQDVKAVSDGLRMVLKQFVDTLDRSGIKRVATVGQAFDPTRHEAIQHLPSAQYPAGVVMAEVQPGYAMGDYLARAALVVVSKGAPEDGGEASAS